MERRLREDAWWLKYYAQLKYVKAGESLQMAPRLAASFRKVYIDFQHEQSREELVLHESSSYVSLSMYKFINEFQCVRATKTPNEAVLSPRERTSEDSKCHFGMGTQDEDSRHFENEVACSSREITSLLREREWNIAGRSGVPSLDVQKSFWSAQFRRTNPRLDVKDY
ncbi:hypothetical protein PGT21_009906 [Puccinia graminis f. sp. tritici]|uniref:Uncharacterized protein n=1 Tax=Puccinia graminis f. sp. tritici TaxID=56615 RepID=A0A5B0NIQ2_PUCGR|nr:hypothetical protein PGT21_009906 [Puccinia graminis f. sp. tritici]